MFTSAAIASAFIGMFACVGVMALADKYMWRGVSRAAIVVAMALSGYCVVAGIFLLIGWHDPLADASAEQIAGAAVRSRGRGGIVILAIRFWPYVLIGLGGFFFYNSVMILWYSRR